MKEATITINKRELTEDQSLAVRIAIVAFLGQLANPRFCAGLESHAIKYHASLTQVMAVIDETPAEVDPPADDLVLQSLGFISELINKGRP
jgi:hypothetical protein